VIDDVFIFSAAFVFIRAFALDVVIVGAAKLSATAVCLFFSMRMTAPITIAVANPQAANATLGALACRSIKAFEPIPKLSVRIDDATTPVDVNILVIPDIKVGGPQRKYVWFHMSPCKSRAKSSRVILPKKTFFGIDAMGFPPTAYVTLKFGFSFDNASSSVLNAAS
jgi:hypothetical protein